jgi:hypothetical protein
MKPNFTAMSRKELRAYILENRDDDEAFYAYMDRLNGSYPASRGNFRLKPLPNRTFQHLGKSLT